MTVPIGYLIDSDFNNGTLNRILRPALIMIKAGNCKFCKITEPIFRQLNTQSRNFNLFFMRPFDGRDPREQHTKHMLYDIVETTDFGFPTFVYYTEDGKKFVNVGSMTLEEMKQFVQTSEQALVMTTEPSFRPYNI